MRSYTICLLIATIVPIFCGWSVHNPTRVHDYDNCCATDTPTCEAGCSGARVWD